MKTIHLERKIAEVLGKEITLTDMFEVENSLNEKMTKCQFQYHDDTVYPFELSINITRNWIDKEDLTPIIEIGFSLLKAKDGSFLSFDNELLQCEKRKKALQDFYFRFEEVVVNELRQTGNYGHKRIGYLSLFEDFRWFQERKAITHSGRLEHVPNLAFTKSTIWASKEHYLNDTLLAENAEARRYVRYFLSHHAPEEYVRSFLEYVLSTNKPIRIIKERSFWNYSFVVRSDMLYADSVTLSKLGFYFNCDHQDNEELSKAMKFAFDTFSDLDVVNVCLDHISSKELSEKLNLFEENPSLLKESLMSKIEKLKEDNEEYTAYNEKYTAFLDGLLDLHLKYATLYQQMGEETYKRRAEKAKRLWLRYTH